LQKAKAADRLLASEASVFIKDITQLPEGILSVARDGDVIVTMGAGSISAVAGKLMESSHA